MRACTYPGADVPSDHVLLLSSFRLKLSLVRRKSCKQKVLATENLRNNTVRTELQNEINQRLKVIKEKQEKLDSNQLWEEVKVTLNTVAQNKLGYRKATPKKKWITDNILQLMEERRHYKNLIVQEYRRLNNVTRSEIRKAKANWLREECQTIENLQALHDTKGEHSKLKEAAGIYKTKAPTVLVNNNDEIILEKEEKARQWENYVKELFQDNERTNLEEDNNVINRTGPAITKDEIRHALKQAKNNKAVGPDDLPAEIIKLIDEDNLSLLEVT